MLHIRWYVDIQTCVR